MLYLPSFRIRRPSLACRPTSHHFPKGELLGSARHSSICVAPCYALAALLALIAITPSWADDRLNHFELKIRPLLERNCLECHGADSPKGGLRLIDRAGWSEAGVIELGRPSVSTLVSVLRDPDPEIRMPPPSSGKKLTEREIQDIEAWIADGAYDPRESPSVGAPSPTGPKKRNRNFEITPEDESYWAFQPVQPPIFTDSEAELSASQKIDLLIQRKLQSTIGTDASAPSSTSPVLASPREQVRRATLDLWGIPPSPEAVEAFEKAPTNQAWDQAIEILLGSKHYGMRWGRYWLDWVRYAETNGYERDGPKPHAWRYRDYVIDAFHRDKPYDQFIIEQLAGDEWAEQQGWSDTSERDRWRQAIIATGFYRLHLWDDEPDDSEASEFDDADDIMVSIGSAFLGLTVGCARCHDHKFDPISQRDYYSMLTFLRGIDPYGLSKKGGGGRGTGRIQRYLVSEEVSNGWEHARQQRIATMQTKLDSATDPAIRLGIEGEIKAERDAVPPFDAALSVTEIGNQPKPTFILNRGDVHAPREQVTPEVPQILQRRVNIDSPISPLPNSSGLRLQFARWVASPKHPLTARVMVNRIWQRHFGTGIVPTCDDFGRTGALPSNPELLDFLANELIASNWSIHHMHRIMMRTDAYRSSSRPWDSISQARAQEGSCFFIQQIRRLDAEAIRDSILAIAGNLGAKDSGPSVYPTLTQEVRDSANPVSLSQWSDSPVDQQNCRSVFLAVKRSLKIPFLESLDFANSSSPSGIRSVTTTAPQALLLLNDPWVHQQAKLLADRIQREAGMDVDARLERLWRLAFQRLPTSAEIDVCRSLLEDLSGSGNTKPFFSDSAWQGLCRSILNSNEFLYVD
ncbi:MAG: DUF1553 domain-containing protein [Planctomycetes bacterium]|nr:DUF1553 domain-containing protein [Planctomycetota bacterium]